MNILLTGGNGFIGSVVKERLDRRYNVVCYARETHVPPVDILTKLMKDCTVVIHLAGGGGHKECETHPKEAIDNNILLTSRLVSAAWQCKVKQFIFSSSIAAYTTNTVGQNPLYEDYIPMPDDTYGMLKICCEEIVKLVPYTILRFANAYGFGTGKNQEKGGFINNVCKKAKETRKIMLSSSTLQMDFVHVNDIAHAIGKTIGNTAAINQTINIGSGHATSLLDVVEIIKKNVGFPIDIVVEEKPTYATRWMDVHKAHELLQWTPSISLQEGIIELLKHDTKGYDTKR